MVTSYNFALAAYEFSKAATVIDSFYLPDSFLETPGGGDAVGVRISEDTGAHTRFLSNNELSAMGFATVALFTTQFDADKLSVVPANVANPSGADTYIQYSDGANFASSSDFTWDDTEKVLKVGAVNVSDGGAAAGVGNVVVGTPSAGGNITGHYNVAMGSNALRDVTTGTSNIGIGNYAGRQLTNGTHNVCIGAYTGGTSTGNYNTFIGDRAGDSNTMTLAYGNIGMGRQCMYNLVDGEHNVCIGTYTGQYLTTGNYNTFVGRNAGGEVATGSNNVFLGNSAGASMTGSSLLAIGSGAAPLVYGDFAAGHLTINDILTVALQTAASASGITPAEGMIVNVSDTDGTFLTAGLWIYQGAAWNAFAFV